MALVATGSPSTIAGDPPVPFFVTHVNLILFYDSSHISLLWILFKWPSFQEDTISHQSIIEES